MTYEKAPLFKMMVPIENTADRLIFISEKTSKNFTHYMKIGDSDWSVATSKREIWEDRGLIWLDCYVIKDFNKKKIIRELLND